MCAFFCLKSQGAVKLLRQSFCNDYKNTGAIKRFRYFLSASLEGFLYLLRLSPTAKKTAVNTDNRPMNGKEPPKRI